MLGSTRSGCQPRRYSSNAVGFCVQTMATLRSKREMHWLQPMHSADVVEPAFLDLARQEGIGDGGAGAADDVALAGAERAHHLVGSVKRPTFTTGTLATFFTSRVQGAW